MTAATNSSSGDRGRRRAQRPRAKPGPALLGAFVLMLQLAACSGDDEMVLACPDVLLVPDAARLVGFAGPGRDLTDVRFEVVLQSAALACEYDEEGMEGVLQVSFVASRGPADSDRLAPFTYFVAVVTADKQVVTRRQFDLAVPFEGNRTRIAVSEELTSDIPLKSGESALDYQIFVGLSLTPEQLRYNRGNR